MNSIFTNTLKGIVGQRPPVWYMRQAGRVLPEYQLLRKEYTFAQLMADPNLAARVTLMPVADLNVDAAIVFSDILIVPVAMGMTIEWTEHGPIFTHPLSAINNPQNTIRINENVFDSACQAIAIAAQSDVPIIGFCGAPLTTLCYMLQGNSAHHDFPEAKKYFYTHTHETKLLVDAITELSITYARKQIAQGASAFQLFDTHASIVPADVYEQLFLPSVIRIAHAVRECNIPFIYFPKGLGAALNLITPDVCDFVSIDWQTPLTIARKLVHPSVGLQGNIDPHLLFATQEQIANVMEQTYKPFFRQNPNWIINLGHGVVANTPVENLRFLTHWIKETYWL